MENEMLANRAARKCITTECCKIAVVASVWLFSSTVILTGCNHQESAATSQNGIVINSPVAATLPPKKSGSPFRPLPHAIDEKQVDGTNCSLDAISGVPAQAAMVLDHDVAVELQGWAADDHLGVPPQIAFLLSSGDKIFAVEGPTGVIRPDVASARGNPAFSTSGYAIGASLEAVPQGEYTAALIEQFGQNRRYCALGRIIAVK